MAPNSATIAALFRQSIHYHLDNFAYENALFFAERLFAHERVAESAFLLALSHLRLGDLRSACEASRQYGYRGTHLGCAFVFAQSCLDLERFKDGITALEKSRPLWTAKCTIGKHTASARSLYPDAAVVSCLLGKLYRGYDDKKKAIQCFEDALRGNPFMWDAFTNLCDMGVDIRIPNIFRATDAFARNFDQDGSTGTAEASATVFPTVPEPLQKKSVAHSVNHDNDPFEVHRSAAFQDVSSTTNNALFAEVENDLMAKIVAAQSRYPTSQGNRLGPDGMATPPAAPPAVPEPQAPRAGFPTEPPQAPARRTRTAQPADPSALGDGPPRMSHRLAGWKRVKGKEQTGELSEPPAMGSSALSLSATERKRTASGHPVQPRVANGEEPRRSARLNVFPRTAVAKAATTTTTAGATSTRELKKARPQISRIMRPGSSGSSVGRVVSGNRKPVEESNMDIDQVDVPRIREPPVPQIQPPKPVESESVKVDEALKWILELLKKMASGYLSASQFKCQEALNTYTSLPRSHQDTPWVLAQMGRAHYEQANYAEAEKFFRRLRVQAPTRHEDMEVYSTVLWLLRKETDLSFLAHELVDAAWDSPQAWCALGNAWSLACDHEQALRCFKRAIQLHPNFAYAYTLQGHEHFENEEYDKALTSYRHAISADKRHYNAYYGIGKVYEKLGNYDKALSHYNAALMIHPKHAVLNCCIGTVLQRQKHIVQALTYFSKAVELAPKAPDVRLRKARALLATGQLKLAQQELLVLKDLAPDKAQVHYLLGKMAKAVHDKKSAVRHFTIALSLDPKASPEIKGEIEGLEDDEVLDDSMMH
ncbi:protein bima [Podospora aff. communis PSN243]|uniref:Protein bima n=1 Tax=Podospora aff. communis PSN243 TaxID=3040156 RepID=A0AAV9GLJ1_9PEZI|nr:protein bima [Podospora aff. communis PSN243]